MNTGSPFKYPISQKIFYGDDEFHIKVFNIIESPEKYLIRRVRIPPNSEELLLRKLLVAQKAFLELGEFGLLLPKFQIIKAWLPKDREPSFMILTEIIKGYSLPMLEVIEKNQQEVHNTITNWLINLITYTQFKYTQNGDYPSDLLPHQFVFGENNEGQKGVYWVDLDPITELLNHDIYGSIEIFLERYLGFIVIRILDFEQRTSLTLTQAREHLETFFQVLETNSEYKELVQLHKGYLSKG